MSYVENCLYAGDLIKGDEVHTIASVMTGSVEYFRNVYGKDDAKYLYTKFSDEGQSISEIEMLNEDFFTQVLKLDGNWDTSQVESGLYPKIYKLDQNGDTTSELLENQPDITIV